MDSDILDISPIGVTLVNGLGQITYANKKAEEILGLSISKENAQLLGGDIDVFSVKGEGSTFI